ncbi:MAG: DNA polymerase III subunit beta [bacterium]
MKIECSREKLHSAVAHAERSTNKNQNLPVLSCILLTAKDNSVILRSTNLDIGVEIDVPAKVSEEGDIAVPGSILYSYISGISNEKNIILEEKDGNLHITSSRTTTTIKTLPHNDFPSLPHIEHGYIFTIHSEDLCLGLKSVWYSASVSSMKPELSSVYVYGEDEYAVFVATDSFRLAEKRVRVDGYKDGEGMLIPYKNVPEIIKIFDGVDGEVDVSFDKNQVSFKYQGIYVISRLVNGSFPDYRQIIPKEFASEAVIIKQDLVNALKLSTVFSDKFNQINITVSPNEKNIQISTKNSDVGENTSVLHCSVSGDQMASKFNHKYINDSFQSVFSDSISLSFAGAQRPLVIRGASDKTFTYLVMPMNR